MLYISLLFIVLGTTAYDLFEKTLPRKENHYFYLILTYTVAFVFLIISLVVMKYDFKNIVSDFNFESIVVGFAAMFIDYGLITAYHKGWKISVLNITYTIISFCILLVLGTIFFNERLTGVKIVGLILCILSLFLIYYKQNVKIGRR